MKVMTKKRHLLLALLWLYKSTNHASPPPHAYFPSRRMGLPPPLATVLPWQNLSFISPALLLLLILPLFFVWTRASSSSGRKGLLPPGPPKYPLIGNLHLLTGPSPHRTLRDLSLKYGPLMHMKLGQVPTLVVSSPEAAKEIMTTHDTVFANRPFFITMWIISNGYTDIVFSPFSDYWRQLRKICSLRLLSVKRVESFRHIREDEVSSFVSSLRSIAGSPFNFQEKSLLYTTGVVTRIALGKKNEERDRYVAALTELLEKVNLFGLADVYPSLRRLFEMGATVAATRRIQAVMNGVVQTVINQHREKRANRKGGEEEEDLVDVFLKVQEEDDLEIPLKDEGIISTIHDIFTAGSDTSATTMEWAMAEMMNHREVMGRAQAEVRRVFGGKEDADESGLQELVYLKAVIKETLRLHPPAPLLIPRENSETREVNGYSIPRKTRVIVNAWAIGRDPRYWVDSERFDPDRFLNTNIDHRGPNFEYLPFGGGRRMCPGIYFGTPMMELLLAQLLFHFDWKLGNGEEKVDMEEAFSIVMRKKHPLILIPLPLSS